MLENLLNTKLKKRILAILYAFDQRSFGAAELREMTGGSIKQIIGTLQELLRLDAVKTATRQRRRYFQVNPYFHLYQEVGDLLADAASGFKDEDLISRRLKRLPDLKLVILSGIFTLQPKLPVDALLVGEEMRRQSLEHAVADIENLIGTELNYTFMTPQEFEHRRMMNDRFIRDILDYPHVIVAGKLK